jgi:iron complex outermembrane receptor protein
VEVAAAALRRLGDIAFTGKAGLTRGKRVDGGNLYHMMPFNVLAALEQHRAPGPIAPNSTTWHARRWWTATAWSRSRQLHRRQLRSSYQFNQAISVNAGISNLFNRNYADPLGGSICRDGRPERRLQALPGYGRSLDVGVNVSF